MIKTQPVADRGSLVNRVKNKLSRIAIRTLRAPYFYPDPKDLLPWIMEKVGSKKYMISKIEITGDQAHVISFVTISHIPSSWLEQDLFLVFRGGKWLIKKQSHGTHLEDSPHAHADRR